MMNNKLLLFANSVERHTKEINGNVQPTGKCVERAEETTISLLCAR